MGFFDQFNFEGLSPEVKAALVQGGLGMGSGLLTGIGQSGIADQNRDLTRQGTLVDSLLQLQQREAGNPYDQLRNQQVADFRNNFISNGMNTPGQGQLNQSLYSPEAMASAKTQFDAKNQSNRGDIYGALGMQQPGQPGQPQEIPKGYHMHDGQLSKDGSGFWHKLAKIGAIAAPIVAAPFTGGASLAMIGAGAGAAEGALSGGGWKGAALGAGLGAIPGLGGAGQGANAARQAGMSATQAIEKAVLNPRALAQIGSSALPGKAGMIAGMASSFLPGANWGNSIHTGPMQGPGGASGVSGDLGPQSQSFSGLGQGTMQDQFASQLAHSMPSDLGNISTKAPMVGGPFSPSLLSGALGQQTPQSVPSWMPQPPVQGPSASLAQGPMQGPRPLQGPEFVNPTISNPQRPAMSLQPGQDRVNGQTVWDPARGMWVRVGDINLPTPPRTSGGYSGTTGSY